MNIFIKHYPSAGEPEKIIKNLMISPDDRGFIFSNMHSEVFIVCGEWTVILPAEEDVHYIFDNENNCPICASVKRKWVCEPHNV